MKRIIVCGLILILFLIMGVQSLVDANPRPIPLLPSSPDKSEPSITISLPQENQTYTNKTIEYSLTVTKPTSWFETMNVHGEVMFVFYLIDQNASENQIAEVTDIYSKQPLNYKGTLTNLSEGNHTFQIKVRSCSYYNHFYDANNSNTWKIEEYYYINTYSELINFTVNNSQQNSLPSPTQETQNLTTTPTAPEFPILAIIPLVMALVSTFVVMKRKHQVLSR
jgi:hypothetical protein